MLSLLRTRSQLTLSNKLLIYNAILKPTWTYGLELLGSTKPSNLSPIQTLPYKILGKITNVQFYVCNPSLLDDLKAKQRYHKCHSFLKYHPNKLVQYLCTRTLPDNPIRRLKRQWPRDLLE